MVKTTSVGGNYPINDAPGNDVYRAPTLVFGDSQQMFHGIKEDNYPQLRSFGFSLTFFNFPYDIAWSSLL